MENLDNNNHNLFEEIQNNQLDNIYNNNNDNDNDNNNLDNIKELNNVNDIESLNNFYTIKDDYDDNLDIIPITYFKKDCFSYYCFEQIKDEYTIKDFYWIYNMVISLKLTTFQKNLLLLRFRRINSYCLKNYKSVSNFYNKSKIFIILCGILNPSLLSINNNQDTNYYELLFWIVWSLQLLVSITTSFISFYKWDKKYFLYSSYKSKINQEIWLYLELSGKYSKTITTNLTEEFIEQNINDNDNLKIVKIAPNHKNQLPIFLERIEYLFKKLKDFDLEIETNDEEKKDINNRRYFKKKNNNSPENLQDQSPNN